MHGANDIEHLEGMLPRAIKHVFQLLQNRATKSDQSIAGAESKPLAVTLSVLEVYSERLRDLLSNAPGKPRLKIRAHKDGSV